VAFAFNELVLNEGGKGETVKQVETTSEEFIRLMQVDDLRQAMPFHLW
jgi:hypothetical protein